MFVLLGFVVKLAMHEAIMEEREADDEVDEDDSKDGNILLEDEDGIVATPRVRNRPKRAA